MNHLIKIVFESAPEYFRQLVNEGMDKDEAVVEFTDVINRVSTDEVSESSIEETIEAFEKSL